ELAKAKSDAVAARRAAELSTLRSPINGVITRLNATMGASADASQVLVEIADPTALDILFSVTPTDAGRIHSGAKVSLSAGQDANGEPLGVGSVVDIASTVDSLTRSVAVRVRAPTTKRPLRIGETVFGQIVAEIIPDAIVVPIEALVPDGAEFKVFVVDATGLARERTVEVGARTATMAQIVDGLVPGERVATQGAYGLEDSVKVIPLKTTDTTGTKKPD
ncbi:MAG TPA: efflux RND transporter periplasmic adaptor subunit, partial [Gemmatimonadaceae bacterium]